jgi:hypothetical protein
MITQATATRMIAEFEQEVQRVGFEVADKRPLISIFGYLALRCSDGKFYASTKKLEAVRALELRLQRDRIGQAIIAPDGTSIMGFDPAGTDRGAKTIGAILRELRALLVELPVTVQKPAPIILPPMMLPGTVPTSAIEAVVAAALAARDAQQKVTAGV